MFLRRSKKESTKQGTFICWFSWMSPHWNLGFLYLKCNKHFFPMNYLVSLPLEDDFVGLIIIIRILSCPLTTPQNLEFGTWASVQKAPVSSHSSLVCALLLPHSERAVLCVAMKVLRLYLYVLSVLHLKIISLGFSPSDVFPSSAFISSCISYVVGWYVFESW